MPTEFGLYVTTSTIHIMNYSRKFISTETFYIIPQVTSTVGIIHVRLRQLKTMDMITPVQPASGNSHLILCQLKTVYMIPPVLSTAGIIHVSFANWKPSI